MRQKTDLVPPEPSKGDYAHAIAKGAIGSMPVAGNLAAELFQLVLGPPLQKRQQEWMEKVADAIDELRDKAGVQPDELSARPNFVDTMCRATQLAVRTSQNEKLDALRNAVLNAALPDAPDESLQQIFLGWVDGLTVWHVRILALLADPQAWFQRNGRLPPERYLTSSLQQLILDAYPELGSQQALLEKIGEDLYQQRLINTHGLTTIMTGRGAFAKRASELGEKFLRFISKPPSLN